MAIKVLLINDFKNMLGGVENYINELMKQNTSIVFRRFGKTDEPCVVKKFYNFETKIEIQKEIDYFKPDIIHAFNIGRVVTPSFMANAFKKSIPIIMSFRDYHYICPKTYMIHENGLPLTSHDSAIECILHHLPKKNIIFDFLKYYKIQFHKIFLKKYLSFFITPSDHLTGWVKRHFPQINGCTLPNPLLLSRPNDSSCNNSIRKNILFVGRISKEKGINTLIDAFQLLLADYPDEKLIIVGNGPEEKKILHYINKNDLKNIELVGFKSRKEIAEYYSSAKFTVIPSEWIEAFGNVLLESFALKTPVIVSDTGCLKVNTKKSDGGLIFKMGSSKDLAQKIEYLLSNPSLCKKLGENGYQYSRKFSFSIHLESLTKIYEGVISSNSH